MRRATGIHPTDKKERPPSPDSKLPVRFGEDRNFLRPSLIPPNLDNQAKEAGTNAGGRQRLYGGKGQTVRSQGASGRGVTYLAEAVSWPTYPGGILHLGRTSVRDRWADLWRKAAVDETATMHR